MGKRILCIGDSNTWGYIPGSGERYEKMCAGRESLHRCLGKTMK